MKKIGIMQPYFLPYIGYFQLMNYVDEFVVYDNIQFTKRGWIHRNRILQNEKDIYISLPVKKDSDYLNIKQRFLAEDFDKQKLKLVSKIKSNYRKAPYFEKTFSLVEEIFSFDDKNLFSFVYNSILVLKKHLGINTQLIISSKLDIDHSLKSANKVKAIVIHQNADIYVNPIGGKELYSKDDFRQNNIDLCFIKTNNFKYTQYGNEFVKYLSIIDVLFFNDVANVKTYLNNNFEIF